MTSKPTPPYDECVEKFLDDVAVPRTRGNYAVGCKLFGIFLNGWWPQAITNDVLVKYWRWLGRRKPAGRWQKDSAHLSPQTVKTHLATITAFLSALNDEELLPDTFSLERAKSKLKKKTKENKAPYPFREPNNLIPLVVKHYDSIELPPNDTNNNKRARLILLRNRAIVHTLYSTAGRINEVAQLSRNDVGEGHSETAIIVGKGSKPRTLYFTVEARRAIQAYLKERTDTDRALFIGHRRSGRLDSGTMWRVVKQAAKAQGLQDVHPHDFRHLRASQMLSEGAPLEVVQEILGHADISTTRRIYAAFSQPAIKEAFNSYSLTPDEALAKAQKEGHHDSQSG